MSSVFTRISVTISWLGNVCYTSSMVRVLEILTKVLVIIILCLGIYVLSAHIYDGNQSIRVTIEEPQRDLRDILK